MKIIKIISQLGKYLSMVTIIVMMLLIMADVFSRFIFSSPISGTAELTEILMVWMVLSAGYCALEGRHVKVDLIVSQFSPRIQSWFDIITLFFSLGIYCIIVSQGIEQIKFAVTYDIKTTILELPQTLALGIFTLTFAILCLAIVSLIIQRIVEVFNK